MDTLLASHKEDMKVFEANFDRWYLESELFSSGAVPKTLEFLKGRGMVFEKDGAVWLGTLNAEGSTDDKDRVLVKSTGKPTYFLPDIAYHKDKYDRGFERVIDIFGADHHGYVARMRAAIGALGKPPESYHAIVHQLIHLFRGREAVKMSKRAGAFISLRELIDEVGKDACRFFFALRTPDSHLNFDLELAKKQSSENPVFYVQYVHARICSIFRKAAQTGLFAQSAEMPMPNARYLLAPEERALLNKLAWLPEVLLDCERLLSPIRSRTISWSWPVCSTRSTRNARSSPPRTRNRQRPAFCSSRACATPSGKAWTFWASARPSRCRRDDAYWDSPGASPEVLLQWKGETPGV